MPVRSYRSVVAASALAATFAGCLWAIPAQAQMFREPFSFGPRNPAGMAVFMRQREDARSAANSFASAGSTDLGETLVCAGTGTTSATSAGNIMCVLAGDGARVIVGSNQDSNGNQTSDANTNTAADQIQDILDGGDLQ
jgi:hypothetical protein